MKKLLNKFKKFLRDAVPVAVAASVAIGPIAQAQTFPSNTLKFGNGAASNKSIIVNKGAGSANPQIRWNESTDKLQFSNDGSVYQDFGSGSGGGDAGINSLNNPGFENGASVNWTNSGGTYTEVTSGSNLLFGTKSVTFDASSSGQYFQSDLVDIPVGLQGNNCSVGIYYKGGDANLTLKALDGSDVLLSSLVLATSTTAKFASVGFVCPSSGQYRLRVESTANAAVAAFDNARLGDFTSYQVSQAAFVGSSFIPGTANCQPSRTNTALGPFGTDADCPGPTIEFQNIGTWVTTDTDLPQQTINNLPAGNYRVRATVTGATGAEWTFALSDGTTITGHASGSGNATGNFEGPVVMEGNFTYTSAGNRTFSIYGASSSLALTIDNQYTSPAVRITFSVYRYPTNSENVIFTAADGDFGWTDGGSVTIGATTTAPTKGATPTRDKIWYKRVGDTMFVRGEFVQVNAGSAGSGDYLFTIPGGQSIDTNKVATYTTVEGDGTWNLNNCVGTGAVVITATQGKVCVVVYSATQVRLFAVYTDGATPSRGVVSSAAFGLGTASVNYSFEFAVPISGWNNSSFPVPLMVNSVVTPHAGVTKLVSASIANTGTPTVTRQTGSWISSITDNGTGDMTINFTGGTFSAAPSCTVTGVPNSDQGSMIQIYDFGTARSSSLIRVRTQNGAAAQTDQGVEIICTGNN